MMVDPTKLNPRAFKSLLNASDCGDVADEKELQHHACVRARAEEEREDEDMEHAQARESGLRDAHANRTHHCEHPVANRHR